MPEARLHRSGLRRSALEAVPLREPTLKRGRSGAMFIAARQRGRPRQLAPVPVGGDGTIAAAHSAGLD